MSILPQPLRLSRSWAAGKIGIGCLCLLAAVLGVAGAAWGVYAGEWVSLTLLILTILGGIGLDEFAKIRQARQLVADGEEITAQLLSQEDHIMRDKYGVEHRSRHYRLLVEGVELPYGAGARVDRPLFLDEQHTQALCVRSKSQPHVVLVVRNDLKPFASTDAEYRAVRERIEQLREVKKLVSDIHTC